jgi:hypothetical protein
VRISRNVGGWLVAHRRDRALWVALSLASALVLTCTVTVLVASGPSEEAVEQVERLIVAGDPEAALGLLAPLIDEYPEDARLSWARGRALALTGDKAAALRAYGDAIEYDAGMLDDREFYAELTALLDEPELRDEAIDLAVREMGDHGHPFLVEQLNREQGALPVARRHGIIAELEGDPKSAKLIDRKLQNVLDLRQAQNAPEPCRTFDRALERMVASPDPQYLGPTHSAEVPRPAPDASDDEIATCAVLDERLERVRQAMVQRYGSPPLREATPPSAAAGRDEAVERDKRADAEAGTKNDETDTSAAKPAKTAKSRKAGRTKKSDRCRGFGAIFKKGCR